MVADSEMPDQFAGAFQDSISIGEQRAAVEAKVHTILVGHHVAKPVFHRLACEGEANCNGVPVDKAIRSCLESPLPGPLRGAQEQGLRPGGRMEPDN